MRAFFLWCMVLFPVVAQAQMGKLDGKQPIEITADQLEVLQPQQQAIFSGNVLAKQGDIDMKAAKMVVHYTSEKQKDSSAQGIEKIEATGDVFFATPAETARGSRALYDVNKDMIYLYGDVVLTRDQNVLKGSELRYNLAEGRSVVSGGVSGQAGGGRVKGLFVPKGN